MERPALVLVLLAGCWIGTEARPPAQTPAPVPARPSGRPPLEISLERTACLGRCPVYKIAIRDAGRVEWRGAANVAAPGPRTRPIQRADVDALDRELAAARFFDRDAFGFLPKEPVCVTSGNTRSCSFTSYTLCSDTSRTILTVRRGSLQHRIENDHCSDEDPALAELERRIIERAGVAPWIGR
jgi:hypothetical protein